MQQLVVKTTFLYGDALKRMKARKAPVYQSDKFTQPSRICCCRTGLDGKSVSAFIFQVFAKMGSLVSREQSIEFSSIFLPRHPSLIASNVAWIDRLRGDVVAVIGIKAISDLEYNHRIQHKSP